MSVAARRLGREFERLKGSNSQFRVTLDKDNLFKWRVVLLGPPGTVYEGGQFHVTLNISERYPFVPPEVVFKTRIMHCNINTNGTVCLNILKHRSTPGGAWKEALGIEQVLQSLIALLCEPNPDDPLMPSVAALLKSDKAEHDRRARLWTNRYATE